MESICALIHDRREALAFLSTTTILSPAFFFTRITPPTSSTHSATSCICTGRLTYSKEQTHASFWGLPSLVPRPPPSRWTHLLLLLGTYFIFFFVFLFIFFFRLFLRAAPTYSRQSFSSFGHVNTRAHLTGVVSWFGVIFSLFTRL